MCRHSTISNADRRKKASDANKHAFAETYVFTNPAMSERGLPKNTPSRRSQACFGRKRVFAGSERGLIDRSARKVLRRRSALSPRDKYCSDL
jgi:hypothetical protein